MPIPLDAPDVLEREFLIIRAKLLETAAALDRLDRAEGSVSADPRVKQIDKAIEVLGSPSADRAERLQMIFSIPYDDDWQETYFRNR